MAQRPVFCVSEHSPFFREVSVDFMYYGGFSPSQKQKCVRSLHESFQRLHPKLSVLEISTKSEDPAGVALSAFTLRRRLMDGDTCSLEAVFQASKVFERGGPYVSEIRPLPPWEAKRHPLLKESGRLLGFELEGESFPLEPPSFFYDWLYVTTVRADPAAAAGLPCFDAFTDIEFNPKKSINCQARSAAIYASLCRAGLLDAAVECPGAFLQIVYGESAGESQCILDL